MIVAQMYPFPHSISAAANLKMGKGHLKEIDGVLNVVYGNIGMFQIDLLLFHMS